MRAVLRAELFKQRTTQTGRSLFGAMLCLVLFAVVLHGALLPTENIDGDAEQLTAVFGWGALMSALFAALLGALSITSEFRHGTIRPTLLATPARGLVIVAKVLATMLIGAGFGFVAAIIAASAGAVALRARSVDVRLDGGDYALLIAGGVIAASLWAALGVGLGAIVRNQVPALVGICAWLLFVENLLVGDFRLIGDVGRLLPGAAGQALSGQNQGSLVSPGVGLVLLVLYAGITTVAGYVAISRSDID